MTNILLSSAGRRSYLVRYFNVALKGEGKVFVCNSIKLTTAMQEAEHSMHAPKVFEPEYLDFMLDLCRKNEIKMLFSLHDLEAPVLAKNIELFKSINTLPIVSPLETINICIDKYASYKFFESEGFQSPKTYIDLNLVKGDIKLDKIKFPLIIKPRYGFGSINMFKAIDKTELEVFYSYIKKRIRPSTYDFYNWDKNFPVVIQEFLDGREYGIEIVNDLEGNYLKTFKKLKFAMRNGETDGAEIIENIDLEIIGKKLSEKLKAVGMLDVDLFHTSKGFEILEINPRFGGQYPFSHMAGANLPKLYLDLYANKKVNRKYLSVKTGQQFLKDIKIKAINKNGSR